MNRKTYQNAIDHLHTDERLEERLMERLRAETQKTAAHTSGIRRLLRRPLAAAAAIVLVLAFGTGTALGAAAIVRSLSTETQAEIETERADSLAVEVEKLLKGNDVNWARDTFLDADGAMDGFKLHMNEMLYYEQEEPAHYIFLNASYETARTDLRPDLDDWKLTANGKTVSSRENMTYHWEDGTDRIACEFPYEGKFQPGEPFTISAEIHTYNEAGAVTGTLGTISVDFSFTAEQAEAKRRDTATTIVEYDRQDEERYLKNLQEIPAESTPVHVKKNGVELVDVSEKDGVLYFGMLQENKESWTYLRTFVDGYEGAPREIYYQAPDQPHEAAFFRCFIPRDLEKLPETSLIAVIINMNSDVLDETVLFRYNWKSGAVTLPKDEKEEQKWYASFTEERASKSLEYLPRTASFQGMAETKSGVTVEPLFVEFTPEGYLYFSAMVTGMHSGDMTTFVRPKILVNGREAPADEANVNAPEVFSDYASETTDKMYVGHFYHPPMNYMELSGDTRITIVWELFDLTPELDRIPVGTFQFEKTFAEGEIAAATY